MNGSPAEPASSSVHVSTGQTTSDLCTQVAQKLLDQTDWQASDLDFIIVATMSPDYMTPATAAIVQGRIGAKKRCV